MTDGIPAAASAAWATSASLLVVYVPTSIIGDRVLASLSLNTGSRAAGFIVSVDALVESPAFGEGTPERAA
jgi:hypothetical protein